MLLLDPNGVQKFESCSWNFVEARVYLQNHSRKEAIYLFNKVFCTPQSVQSPQHVLFSTIPKIDGFEGSSAYHLGNEWNKENSEPVCASIIKSIFNI